jgi:hypothetical protein
MAVILKKKPPRCSWPRVMAAPAPWDGRDGDERLRTVAAFLSKGRDLDQSMWPLVATYFPGRTGLECYERWMQLRGVAGKQFASPTVEPTVTMPAVEPAAVESAAVEPTIAVVAPTNIESAMPMEHHHHESEPDDDVVLLLEL